MGFDRQPKLKKILLLFGLPIIDSVVGNAANEHLITAAIPFLPNGPYILYSIFATAFAIFDLTPKLVSLATSRLRKNDVR